MPHGLRFGIVTGQSVPWPILLARWQTLDTLGFDTAWVGDHFAPPTRPTGPWFDGWTTLAALAVQTQRLRLGVLISNLAFHPPALLARRALTVDHLAQGRLELGLGAGGGVATDHTMTGLPDWGPAERVDRFQESLVILDRLLRQEVTTVAGPYYPLHEAVLRPVPVQRPRPPFVLAAHRPRLLRLAAAWADTWVSWAGWGVTPAAAFAVTERRNAQLTAACHACGRDPQAVERAMLVLSGQAGGPQPFGSVAAFHTVVGRYRALGITHFLFTWPPPEQQTVFEQIATEVLPALRCEPG